MYAKPGIFEGTVEFSMIIYEILINVCIDNKEQVHTPSVLSNFKPSSK